MKDFFKKIDYIKYNDIYQFNKKTSLNSTYTSRKKVTNSYMNIILCYYSYVGYVCLFYISMCELSLDKKIYGVV